MKNLSISKHEDLLMNKANIAYICIFIKYNFSDIIECQVNRDCLFVMLIVGASSLICSPEMWDNIRTQLKGKIISKPEYNLHPNAKDKYKIVQN